MIPVKNQISAVLKTIILLIAVTAPAAIAQNGQGALLRSLDEPVTLNIPEMPINLAITRIASQSGLSIKLDNLALEMLPYGDQTRVRVNSRQSPLGEVLSAILRPMCLSWSIQQQEIIIRPNQLLLRMGRRPSFTETAALASLSSAEINAETPILNQLRTATNMEKLEIVWPDSYADDLMRSHALKAAERQLPSTAAKYLDAICKNRSLTWFLSGEKIIIITQERQVQRLLGRIVSVDYRNRPLVAVINDLAEKASVDTLMTPGVLKTVDAQTRESFTLLIDRATISEAFEAISGATGLVFTAEDGKLKVTLAAEMPKPTKPAPATADFLLVVDVEGTAGEHYQMLIRPDELPKQVADELSKRKKLLIKELTTRYGETDSIPDKSVKK